MLGELFKLKVKPVTSSNEDATVGADIVVRKSKQPMSIMRT